MDTTAIREKNTRDILSTLRFGENYTKRDIAQITNLSFSTVSNMCNELKELGVLSETKADVSSVGRTPSVIQFHYDHFITLCVSLHMDGLMNFAVLNFRNQVLFRHSYQIRHLKTPEGVMDYGKKIFRQLQAFPQIQGKQFVGAGIAISGCFHERSGRVYNCALPIYEDSPLLQLAQEAFNMPCFIENEANLCVLSMNTQETQYQNLIYLYVAQGLGLGVLANGTLLRGAHGFGAEISHLPLGLKERRCPTCHHLNCLETDLSLSGFLQDYFPNDALENPQDQWEMLLQQSSSPTDHNQAFFQEKGQLLGRLISALVNLFDPSVLCVGGIVTDLKEHLSPILLENLKEHCPWTMGEHIEIRWDTDSDTTLLQGINQKVFDHWTPFD